MALPNIKFNRKNGQLKRVQPTTDNVFALALSGVAVPGKIALNEGRLITSIEDLDTLGITLANNPLAFTEVTNFYAKSEAGTKLWITLFSDAMLLADICNKNTGVARNLLLAAGGEIRGIYLNKTLPAGYTSTMTDGLDADVWNAVASLQALCEAFGDDNTPLYGVLPAIGFDITNLDTLRDLNTMNANRVAILAGADASNGKFAMGTLAGWRAKQEIHQNIGWVGLGAVLEKAWLGNNMPADDPSIKSKLDTLHDKRYIFFRKIPNKSGHFFNDDPTATKVSDDYSSISWNAVINKAQVLAYNSLVDHLNEEVEVDETTGLISPILAADWEGNVERAVISQMRQTGQISGVRCRIDVVRSNLAADQISATLEIVRKGQAKYITIDIGYTPSLT
jgi:hypothetical protein